MRQCVQHSIVQLITGRLQGVAQLCGVQVARVIVVVQLEHGLPFGDVGQQLLELFEAQLAGAILVHHGDHRTAHVLGEAVLLLAGLQNWVGSERKCIRRVVAYNI